MKVPWCEGKSAAGSCSSSAHSEEHGNPGDLLLANGKRNDKTGELGRSLRIKSVVALGGQLGTAVGRKNVRRPKGAKKKYALLPLGFEEKTRRAGRRLPEAAGRYSISPGARNAACAAFTTGLLCHRLDDDNSLSTNTTRGHFYCLPEGDISIAS